MSKRLEYEGLLDAATAVVELDGKRPTLASRQEAYVAVGRFLVRQCDILLAIWDGQPAEGPGGTADVVREARLLGLPVVRIDSATPHNVTFLRHDDLPCELEEAVRSRLVPVEAPALSTHADGRFPTRKAASFDCLTKLWGDGKWQWSRKIPQYPEKFCLPSVWRHYVWADRLAMVHASRARSATVLMYFFAWLAVVFALAGVPLKEAALIGRWDRLFSIVITLAELACIGFVIVNLVRAQKGWWHDRWLTYRALAEHLRVLDFLNLLGRTIPEFRAPVHATVEDPASRWMEWYFRAIVREIGMASIRITPDYLAWAQGKIHEAIADQAAFHKRTAHRYHRIHHRMHLAGESLFGITLLLCLAHLGHGLLESPDVEEEAQSLLGRLPNWMVFGAAMLPATGASLSGVAGQSEFKRLAQRYEGMHSGLSEVQTRLAPDGSTPSHEELGENAEEAAKVLLAEVQDWRLLFKARPPVLPA